MKNPLAKLPAGVWTAATVNGRKTKVRRTRSGFEVAAPGAPAKPRKAGKRNPCGKRNGPKTARAKFEGLPAGFELWKTEDREIVARGYASGVKESYPTWGVRVMRSGGKWRVFVKKTAAKNPSVAEKFKRYPVKLLRAAIDAPASVYGAQEKAAMRAELKRRGHA